MKRERFVRSVASALLVPAVIGLLAPEPALAAIALGQAPVGNAGSTALSRTATFSSPPASGHLLLAIGAMPAASASVAPNAGWSSASVIVGENWALAIYYKIAGGAETAAQTPWSQSFAKLGFGILDISGQRAVSVVSGKTKLPFNAKSFARHASSNAITNTGVVPSVAGTLALAVGVGFGATSGAVVTGGWTTDLSLGTAQSSIFLCHLANPTVGVEISPRYAWASALTQGEWLSCIVLIQPGP